MAAVSPKVKLADTALRLLAKTRWTDLTIAAVARAAKTPLASLQAVAPNKPLLFGLILNRIGADVARTYRPERKSDDVRDRLLDVALTWFEALRSRKAAVRSLYEGLRRDPLSLLAARTEIVSAANWLLTLAEADTGRGLPARALAFAGILSRAIPIWLEDDQQMSATMARLGEDLRRSRIIFGQRSPAD